MPIRNIEKFLSTAVVACAISMASVAQAEDLDFQLINKSSASLVEFYVSHSGTEEWEDNLLDGAYLPSGNVVSVVIGDGRTTCVYDISGTFSDGEEFSDYELDLCDLGEYTFYDE